MKKIYILIFLITLLGEKAFAQNMDAIVRNHLYENYTKSGLTTRDVLEWKVTDIVPSLNPEIQHVYVQQYYQEVPIQYATYKFTVKNKNKVTWEINQFVDNIETRVTATNASLTPEDAILNVVKAHNLSSPKNLSSSSRGENGEKVYADSGISLEPIKVKQVYQKVNDQLHLSWNVSLYQKDGKHWWNVNVDATTGKIIHTEDWVISCDFGTPEITSNNFNSILFEKEKENTTFPNSKKATTSLNQESYNVYAMPLESPIHGNRTIVTNPSNAVASPYGWHDTNGSSGAEYTYTRGNNVWAMEDKNGNNGTGASPDGGSGLNFDFPIDFNQSPGNYIDASVTNLFYWNNIMHDIWYQYGFDEASGNFQENNYGNGGEGSDSVNADAQDGSGTNNANFSTPGDGSNPRMQMFLFTNPTRDGDLDAGIICHEYGHGISIRLVGGPNTNGLGGSEQMGEGWSDWFGLMLTMREGDTGTDGRGVGSYALGQQVGGAGIRPTRYSTDTAINSTTYADINNLAVPHGVGYAWATILWDMAWALIDIEGFDSDFYNGTGGNNIAMALVLEGLKNTPNNPGFVSGRDAILQADQDLYQGKYNCTIWTVFSARGVGKDANENSNGGSNTNTDQIVSFVNGCDSGEPDTDECTGSIASFPYNESFENTIGDWVQSSTDDLNWTIYSGSTPSNGTGPSIAADGQYYLYVEASGNASPNKKAILSSPCIDLSDIEAATFSFYYHMKGSDIGSLKVEARKDNEDSWTSVFSKSGSQGDDWNKAEIDLTSYTGNPNVQLRFNTVTGSGYKGDVAIDAISLTTEGTDPDPDPDPAPDGYCASNAEISSDEYIQRVELGNINNETGASASGYGDYTNLSTDLEANNTITITPKWTGKVYHETYSVWIDFNRDGYFSDSGELVFYQPKTTAPSVTGTFSVPATASPGNTRMRISMKYFIKAKACGSFKYGEVEDYNVLIKPRSINFTSSKSSVMNKIENRDNSTGFDITIAPNPVKKGNALQISIQRGELSNASYSIINLVGQIISKGVINNRSIPLDDLATGMYMLQIENSDIKTIKRFTVE